LFFDRDSGLTARGFGKLGVESGSVTLGPALPGDLPAMRRATWQELENPAWWGKLGLDGLVFYTWGNAQYRRMTEAAMAAGIRVAQVADQQGVTSPVSDWRAHLQAEAAHDWHEPRWKQLARTALKLPYTCTLRTLTLDRAHAQAIAASDFFLASTPQADMRYRRLVSRLVGREAADKVRFVPIPVNFHFTFTEQDTKHDEVIAVGRWDSLQKRTPLLMAAITATLPRRPETRFRIFGQVTPELEDWHAGLPPAQRPRVVLEGLLPNAALAEAYRRARVMLVSAAYEGCHNASAEAICSGATVVACRSPFLSALEWHAGKNSGRLADAATGEALSSALLAELETWDRNERDPHAISAAWTRELHPDKVAARILELFATLDPKFRP
jgi:hypothetical protein